MPMCSSPNPNIPHRRFLPAISTRTLPRPRLTSHPPSPTALSNRRPADVLALQRGRRLVRGDPRRGVRHVDRRRGHLRTPVGVALVSTSCAVGAGVVFIAERGEAAGGEGVRQGGQQVRRAGPGGDEGRRGSCCSRGSRRSPLRRHVVHVRAHGGDFLPYIMAAAGYPAGVFRVRVHGGHGAAGDGGRGKASGLEPRSTRSGSR